MKARRSSSLAPPWTPAAAAAAILVTVVVTALVWHSTRLPGLDAWALHVLGAHRGERQFQLAMSVATGLRALTLGGIVATALVSWTALGGGSQSPWRFWPRRPPSRPTSC